MNPRRAKGKKKKKNQAEFLLLAWFSCPVTERQALKDKQGKKRKEIQQKGGGGGCRTPRYLQHLPSHGGQKYRSNAGSSISRTFRLVLRSKVLLRPESGQANTNKRLQFNSSLPPGSVRRLCASAADFGHSTHACPCAIHSARDKEPEPE